MALTAAPTGIDPLEVKKDFPIFEGDEVHRRLVFLDSAASSQKPRAVLDAMAHYYETTHANVHRGVYAIAEEATAEFEAARRSVARFIGAPTSRSVVFTKNATEAINLVAHSWARSNLRPGDVVLLSEMEHHANFVPWLMLREDKGIELRFLSLGDDGYLVLDDLDRMLENVKLVAISAMSNVLGTIPPARRVADAAHAAGALVLLDGAQYVPHLPTRVGDLGCDFLAFSAHKMCGPTGIGALWAREDVLEAMPAFMGGGEMIRDVRLDGWLPNELPWRFEAGTPPIAEAIGFGAAIDYLDALDMEAVRAHELSLTEYALGSLQDRHGDDLVIHGPTQLKERGGVMSFSYKGIHPHDLAQVLDEAGVCVRAGHHCAKPLMRRLGLAATARASFYVYNHEADVDALSDALLVAADLFG